MGPVPIPVKLAAAMTGTMVVASAAVWWASPWSAIDAEDEWPERPASSTAAPAPPEADDAIICVAPDRVIRAPFDNGKCPPNHREIKLDEEDEALCELCDPNEDPPPRPDRSDDARDAIERRIRALENTAYFEVVTADDRPVFRVGPGGVRVYNAQGMAVAAIGTSDNGGYFSGRSTAGFGDGSIGASGVRAGVRLMETDLSRLELSFQNGRGSIRVPAGSGTIVGVGQTATGAGALIVGTIPGHLRVSLTVTDGRAMAAANGEGDSGGIALLEPSIGGGMLGIDNSQGNAAVKMGHNANRYGIVLAGPVLGFPLIPKSGLPGSYFMGCAAEARPACVPTIDQ